MKSHTFVIQKNVPLATISRKQSNPIYPFDKMEVDDSFGIPVDLKKRVNAAKSVYQRKNPGKIFSVRRIDSETYQVYRKS